MNKRLRWHIIFWISFLAWDTVQVVFSLTNSSDSAGRMGFVASYSGTIDMLMKVVLFYGLYFWIYRPAIYNKRPLYYTITGTLAIVAVSLLLQRTIMYYLVMPALWGNS